MSPFGVVWIWCHYWTARRRAIPARAPVPCLDVEASGMHHTPVVADPVASELDAMSSAADVLSRRAHSCTYLDGGRLRRRAGAAGLRAPARHRTPTTPPRRAVLDDELNTPPRKIRIVRIHMSRRSEGGVSDQMAARDTASHEHVTSHLLETSIVALPRRHKPRHPAAGSACASVAGPARMRGATDRVRRRGSEIVVQRTRAEIQLGSQGSRSRTRPVTVLKGPACRRVLCHHVLGGHVVDDDDARDRDTPGLSEWHADDGRVR